MPGCVRNLSVYWGPGKKFHSWCHCSECWDSSSVCQETDLYREKHHMSEYFSVDVDTPVTTKQNSNFKNFQYDFFPLLQALSHAHLSLMTRVFLTSSAPQVFPLSSGPPSLVWPASFFSPSFSADERWEPELHCPVLWQTAPSSSSESALTEKIWTESRRGNHKLSAIKDSTYYVFNRLT